MGRPCTACHRSDRVDIDTALASGTSYRNIMERASGLSLGGLHRHRNHLGAELAQAATAERLARSDAVLAQLLGLVEVTHRLLARAEADGRDRHALAAIRELRHTLLALGAVAQAVEAKVLRLSGDDGENEALAHALRLVLPGLPACAVELAVALADLGQTDLAGAIRSLNLRNHDDRARGRCVP